MGFVLSRSWKKLKIFKLNILNLFIHINPITEFFEYFPKIILMTENPHFLNEASQFTSSFSPLRKALSYTKRSGCSNGKTFDFGIEKTVLINCCTIVRLRLSNICELSHKAWRIHSRPLYPILCNTSLHKKMFEEGEKICNSLVNNCLNISIHITTVSSVHHWQWLIFRLWINIKSSSMVIMCLMWILWTFCGCGRFCGCRRRCC